MTTNTWPGGYRHGMSQSNHNAWNANNYPGTLQLCTFCDQPTGRCEDDTLCVHDEPVCEQCWNEADEGDRS